MINLTDLDLCFRASNMTNMKAKATDKQNIDSSSRLTKLKSAKHGKFYLFNGVEITPYTYVKEKRQ